MIEYVRIVDGMGINDASLELKVSESWSNHQSYIRKVLAGFGLGDWTIRFVQSKEPGEKGGGCLFRHFNMIVIVLHSKDEMITTLLHEILHYRNPVVAEDEIEVRSVKWYKALCEGNDPSTKRERYRLNHK